MVTPKAIVAVLLSRILRTPDGKIDVSANPRSRDDYSLDRLNRKALQFRERRKTDPELGFGSGIEVPLQFRKVPAPPWQKVDGKGGDFVFQIIKGHLRALIAEMDGIEKVPGLVYEDMPDDTFYSMVQDHGGEEGLDRVGLFNTIKQGTLRSWDHRKIVLHARATFEKLYPISPEQKANMEKMASDEERLKYLAGTKWKKHLQYDQRVIDSPQVLEDAYIQKLRGLQVWPTDPEINELNQAHNKDKLNPDGSRNLAVDRDHPGPRFMALWNRIQAAVAEAKPGEKPIVVARRSTDSVMKKVDNVKSLLERIFLLWTVTDPAIDDTVMEFAEALQLKLEATISPEDSAKLSALLAPKAAPKVEQPKVEQKPETTPAAETVGK